LPPTKSKIPDDLIPADLVPESQAIPNDLIPQDLVPEAQAKPRAEGPSFVAPDDVARITPMEQSSAEDIARKEVNVPGEERIARDLRTGLQNNITAQAAQLLGKAVGIEAPSKMEKSLDAASGSGGVSGLATQVLGGAVDPLGLGILKKGGELAVKAPLIAGVAKKNAALEKLAANAKALQLSESAAAIAKGRKGAMALEEAAKLGGALGAFSASRNAMKQVAEGDFDPAEFATNVGIETALGMGLGAAGGIIRARALRYAMPRETMADRAQATFEGATPDMRPVVDLSANTEGKTGQSLTSQIGRNRQKIFALPARAKRLEREIADRQAVIDDLQAQATRGEKFLTDADRAKWQAELDDVTQQIVALKEEQMLLSAKPLKVADDPLATAVAEKRAWEAEFARQRRIEDTGVEINALTMQRQQLLAREGDKTRALTPAESKKVAAALEHNTQRVKEAQAKLAEINATPGFEQVRAAYEQFGRQKITINGRKVRLYKASISPQGRVLTPDDIRQTMQAKEISAFSAGSWGFRDFERNIEKADNSARGFLKQRIFEPLADAVRRLEQRQAVLEQEHLNRLHAAGITPGSVNKEQVGRLFRIAEGRGTQQESQALSRGEKDLLDFYRKFYDDTLDAINVSRKRNNLPTIPKRKDYIPHLKEIEGFERHGIRISQDELPDAATEMAKRTKAGGFFEKQRTGDAAEEDIVAAFDAYLRPGLRNVFLTDAASNARAYVPFLPPNLGKAVDKFINGPLFGGLDEKDADFVRKGLQVIPDSLGVLGRLQSAGLIGGSLSVMAMQPAQVGLMIKDHGFRRVAAGFMSAMKGLPDDLVRESPFLSHRSVLKDIRMPAGPVMNKVQMVMNVMDRADRIFAQTNWSAAYRHATEEMNLSHKAAVRFADWNARNISASYGAFAKSNILQGKVASGILPFQTFAFNLFNHLTHDQQFMAQIKGTSSKQELVKTLGAMVAMRMVYKSFGLRDPFDLGEWQMTDDNGNFAPRVGVPLGLVPGLSMAKFGAPTAIRAVGHLANVVMEPDLSNKQKALEGLASIAPSVIPLGTQTMRSVMAWRDYERGYSVIGDKRVPVKTFPDFLLYNVQGKHGTLAAQERRQKQDDRRARKTGRAITKALR
jgi:hypothetical protein